MGNLPHAGGDVHLPGAPHAAAVQDPAADVAALVRRSADESDPVDAVRGERRSAAHRAAGRGRNAAVLLPYGQRDQTALFQRLGRVESSPDFDSGQGYQCRWLRNTAQWMVGISPFPPYNDLSFLALK